MDYEKNNNKNHQQENDLYMMVNELKNKYESLEKKQKNNEENSIKNSKAIYNLNINLKILKDFIIILKKQFEQIIGELKELKENIDKIQKENDIDKIKKLSKEQINILENKFSEMSKEIDKKIETQKEIKEIQINKNRNNVKHNIDNNINIEDNNDNNNININNNKNTELRIDKDKQKTIFQKFEILLSTIIDTNNIDNKIKKELNQYCEKLIFNNISPIEYTAKYFALAYKYLKKGLDKEKFEKIIKTNIKVISLIEEIEKKNEIKIKRTKPEKKSNENIDKKIEEFRKKYSIMEEDASDELIKNCLNNCKNKELKAYQSILEAIINSNKKNENK